MADPSALLMDVLKAQEFSQILWFMLVIMIINLVYQRIQTYLWIADIEMKLNTISALVDSDKERVSTALRNYGVKTPELLVERVSEFFAIGPVEIEPIDIIKRLDHILRTEESSIKRLVEIYMPHASKHERSLIETSLAIVGALHQIRKIIQHYLLLGKSEKNWILLMQLYIQLPSIMKFIIAYHDAVDAFITGKPIGDGAGPLLAHNLIKRGNVLSTKVIEETTVTEVWWKDRRVFVIKAEGPGSNVGKPGKVLGDLVERLNGNVSLIVTVDAALKLESEETGSIAEGVGAAIGDPGPEKIAIERAAAKYNIPLRALVVKMGFRDAITVMPKNVYDACERAYAYLERIVEENTKPNDTIIVTGIGNTMGIAG